MAAAAAVGAGGTAPWAPWQLSVLASWIAAAVAYLGLAWLVILRADGAQTHRLATTEDDSRAVSGVLVVAAATSSLAGAALALHKAAAVTGRISVGLTVAAVATVVMSWSVVHTDFALRYAHRHHSSPQDGIDFPGADLPDFRDFAYLAFTVGMTYQVSDTALLTPRFRRIVLAHALVSYIFGAVIIAAVINIVAGIVS